MQVHTPFPISPYQVCQQELTTQSITQPLLGAKPWSPVFLHYFQVPRRSTATSSRLHMWLQTHPLNGTHNSAVIIVLADLSSRSLMLAIFTVLCLNQRSYFFSKDLPLPLHITLLIYFQYEVSLFSHTKNGALYRFHFSSIFKMIHFYLTLTPALQYLLTPYCVFI